MYMYMTVHVHVGVLTCVAGRALARELVDTVATDALQTRIGRTLVRVELAVGTYASKRPHTVTHIVDDTTAK